MHSPRRHCEYSLSRVLVVLVSAGWACSDRECCGGPHCPSMPCGRARSPRDADTLLVVRRKS